MTSTHLKLHVEKCRIVKIPGVKIIKNKDFVCKYCDKIFHKKEFLNSHLKEHIIEAFTCDVCSKSFQIHRI